MVYPISSSQFFAQDPVLTPQQTFSAAVRKGDFVAALNIFVSADAHERKNIADIGDVLVRHLRFDDHHDTALILKCVALAKENGLIDSKIASDYCTKQRIVD